MGYNSFYTKYIKRFLDILISLVAIIVLSPILIVVAILVRTKLGSPILFRQQRPGMNEEIFEMMKFRSMTDEKDSSGKLLPDSQRITTLGHFLRNTSLDELPELINILKGDMSFIGPRPLLIKYLPHYTNTEKKRHYVRPGLTGLAQINGRNNLNWNDRLSLDVFYIENMSLIWDLKIFYKTIKKVIAKEDITIIDLVDLKDLDEERKGKESEN